MTTMAPSATIEGAARMTVLPPVREPRHLDESNHRIANNLQLLTAMISAEARALGDPAARAALDRMQGRVGAIANVHRQLYLSTRSGSVDLRDYLMMLGQDLEASCADASAGRRVRVRAEPVRVPPDVATAIGIIVSEAVTNACKYAYPPDVAGDVWVELRPTASGGYALAIEDRGRGTGATIEGGGLGTRLIAMMSARIGASHCWQDARPGTRLLLVAPAA